MNQGQSSSEAERQVQQHGKATAREPEATAGLDAVVERLRQEIAERQRAEASIRDSQALYSSLVESLPVNVLRKDRHGRFTFANQSFCQLLGRSLEEIVGKTDFDFYPPELARKYRQDDLRVLETGELFETFEENQKGGQTCYVHVMKSPVRDAAGAVIGVQVVFWDVTEQKKAEAALVQERYLLHALMDNLPHNIYFKDRASRFIRINRAMARSFGLSDPSQALGKTDFDFFSEEHARQAYEDEQQIMRTGRPLVDKEEKETWPDGRTSWALTTKMPLYDEAGRIVGTFGVSRDITQQKEAADALRAAKEAAEAASRAKSDFVANMSHEIRTPMNAIIGLTELVLDSELTASQREHLTMVLDSAEALLALISDVLDFSKIEAGKLELDQVEFDLREILGDTMRALALRAHTKGLELVCHVAPDVPEVLVGDPNRLRQIVLNLAGNAIKFTEEGEVLVEVQCPEQREAEVRLLFTVRDTGIGIPEQKLAAIFREFEQVDSSATRRYGGTGLGLAISSRLVELMGGRIWVDSQLGRGSTFYFTARFRSCPAAPSRPVDQLRGMRVLVVDDNATSRAILEAMLASWGMCPDAAWGVELAWQKLQQAQRSGQPYRLVLSDVAMPVADGFALVERIRADPELGSAAVVLMLTAGDRHRGVARCQQLGVAAYLMKPIKQSDLFDALAMALGLTGPGDAAESPTAAEPTAGQLPPLRVLLAEDSLVNQKLVADLLGRWGHNVTVVSNGKEALAALQTRPFDLVLMDVQMPELDGLETTKLLRQRERGTGKHMPILALTAHALKGDRQRCLEAGMDEYLAKPIRSRQLLAGIEALIRRFGIPGGRPSGAKPTDDGIEQPVKVTGDQTAPVDWQAALQNVGGDRRALAELVEVFCDQELPKVTAEIVRAVAGGDLAPAARAAHTLKSSARLFGADAVRGTAESLEQAAEQGRLEIVRQRWQQLERQLDALVTALRRYNLNQHG